MVLCELQIKVIISKRQLTITIIAMVYTFDIELEMTSLTKQSFIRMVKERAIFISIPIGLNTHQTTETYASQYSRLPTSSPEKAPPP